MRVISVDSMQILLGFKAGSGTIVEVLKLTREIYATWFCFRW
jgi:hypothetical protein